MEPWRTAIVDAGPAHIRVRGHDVLDLMRRSSFTDLIFLLHHERLPSDAERRLIDALLIGAADHGAGVPTIGDEHGGAGEGCMELIAAGLERSRRDSISIDEAARRIVDEAKAAK